MYVHGDRIITALSVAESWLVEKMSAFLSHTDRRGSCQSPQILRCAGNDLHETGTAAAGFDVHADCPLELLQRTLGVMSRKSPVSRFPPFSITGAERPVSEYSGLCLLSK